VKRLQFIQEKASVKTIQLTAVLHYERLLNNLRSRSQSQLRIITFFFAVYQCNEDGQVEVTTGMQRDFEDKGYVIVTSLLNAKERERLLYCVENDSNFTVRYSIICEPELVGINKFRNRWQQFNFVYQASLICCKLDCLKGH